jgi:hypothetical protein
VCFKGIAQTFESKTCETSQWKYYMFCSASVFLDGVIANPTHMSKEYGALV